MIQKNILSKYCKLDKSFGRKVEIHQQYLWCGAKTAQIWKKWPQNTSFLPELDAFTIWRSVLKRVKVRREQAVGTEDVKARQWTCPSTRKDYMVHGSYGVEN